MWNSLVRVRMKIAKTGVIFHFSMIHVGYFIKTSVGSPLPPTSDTVASFVLFVSFYFSHHYHQYKCENGGGVFKWELENECSVQGHSHSKHPTTFNWPKHGAYVTPIMHMAGAQAQYTSKPPFQVCAQTQEVNEYSFFFFSTTDSFCSVSANKRTLPNLLSPSPTMDRESKLAPMEREGGKASFSNRRCGHRASLHILKTCTRPECYPLGGKMPGSS